MKEITRIHLAKTAYDIELPAKKHLEAYIHSLNTYTDDAEVLADIEIRMTELLTERGVQAGGVITAEDVAAVRTQLGEPYEFASAEGDIAIGADADAKSSRRRLYRDPDHAFAGGVLSGIAAYFNVNPLWPRVIFIVLLLMSLGTAVLVYAVLWVVLPPAKTATEKLQLAGKPVTLESIRALNAQAETTTPNKTPKTVQRVLTVGASIVSFIGAWGALCLTVWAVAMMYTRTGDANSLLQSFSGTSAGWPAWTSFWLMVAAGLLLTVLLSIIGVGFARQKATKRMFVSALVVTILGVVSICGVIGIVATQAVRVQQEARASMRETATTLPAEFSQVKKFSYAGGYARTIGINIEYNVSTETPRYELRAPRDVQATFDISGEAAQLKIERTPDQQRDLYNSDSYLVVYGPALEQIDLTGDVMTYTTVEQPSSSVNLFDSANLTVHGAIDKLGATVGASSRLDASDATVTNLTATLKSNATAQAGTVKTLSVNLPEVCGSDTYQQTSMEVNGVGSGEVMYNGMVRSAGTYTTGCAELRVVHRNGIIN